MTLKQAIEKHSGLSYVVNQLKIYSPMGRKALLETKFSKDADFLKSEYEIISACQRYISTNANKKQLGKVFSILECIHNISGTIKLLENNNTLDDISLFEIKSFSISVSNIKSLLFDLDIKELIIPNLDSVISILDPEKLQLNQFYIYSAYSKELAKKRKQWEESKSNNNDNLVNKLFLECVALEDEIREELSTKLRSQTMILYDAINTISKIDINFAKAIYFFNKRFSEPTINNSDTISYTKLVYPLLYDKFLENHRTFQPIDISFSLAPTLITGANMAGKTLLLKSISLAQFLAQFFFFLPCENAEICLVENVLISIGDKQNEEEGLSSYASEILLLNDFIQKAKQGKKYLILIDELARTTNPTEGVAIVDSYLKIISKTNSFSITTTHYSGIKTPCKRLRVKGFINKDNREMISIKDIQDHIDYSLIEGKEEKVPNEALNIASLLNIDKELIEEAKKLIQK